MTSKKQQKMSEIVKPGFHYNCADALTILMENASKNFNETIEGAFNLGVDPRKSDQVVRGATKLPKGTGKVVRVAVFAQGDNAKKAKDAGADIVGFEDLAEQIKAGNIDFDVLIATPDAMRVIAPLGQILGPKGLMPNPKVGTVTVNVADAVQDTKSGRVMYRTDKNGIIHCALGKADFKLEDIRENLNAVLSDLKKAKPASAKGVYIKKLTLSSTMGPGLVIDLSTIAG